MLEVRGFYRTFSSEPVSTKVCCCCFGIRVMRLQAVAVARAVRALRLRLCGLIVDIYMLKVLHTVAIVV